MPGHHRIVCGPSHRRPRSKGDALFLDNTPSIGNVHLKIDDVSAPLFEKVPDIFLDLIDIASYVYSADQAFKRHGKDALGEDWRRQLHFQIAVRHPDLWASAEVSKALISTLSFLSDDEYVFEFTCLKKRVSAQGYLGFGKNPYEGHVDGVMLFSGGLDSLGGAIQEAIVDRRKVLLVNHRSNEKLTPRQKTLLRELSEKTGSFTPVFVPVRVNKEKELSHEFTQRSRSFLCAALGATIATMVGLNKVRFYENGIVSLNLPPSPQVIGARATRTTHPRVLAGFGNLVATIAGKPFEFENPFLWKTKPEVVRLIADNGCAALIEHSYSCASPRRSSTEHSHCGECSQCIDRRFAVLAAGHEAHDPANAYGIDLLTGSRGEGPSRLMLAAYVDMAIRVRQMSERDFFSEFGEANRALRFIDGGCKSAAARIWDLHRRHAEDVFGVVTEGIAKLNDRLLLRRDLPGDCLIWLMLDRGPSGAREPSPTDDPPSYLRRSGKAWVIRFNGQQPKHYPDNIGFAYLECLFQHPGRSFKTIDLDREVRLQRLGSPTVAATLDEVESSDVGFSTDGQDDPVIDSATRKDCQNRIKAIDELIDRYEATPDLSSLETKEIVIQERVRLVTQLGGATGLLGKTVQLKSERDRARHRVGHALKRALKCISCYDAVLHQHLSASLSRGHSVSYSPSEDPGWVIFSQKVQTPA